MKLSMWILANQLSFLDPQVHIRSDSPLILHSARRAYATNCVYVYQDGADCVYAWEEDTIRLSDISVSEAFELVQSVFDTMSDWYARITAAISARNYQSLVDQCYQVFKNPTVLIDGNYQVLGISKQFGADDADDEWQYLKTYGCSSPRALRRIRQTQPQIFLAPEVIHFSFTAPYLKGKGLTMAITCGNCQLGRMNVMEKDRPLNRGDMQLMELIAELLRPCLSGYKAQHYQCAPYLNKLLDGLPLTGEELQQLKSTRGWQTDHTFQLYLLCPLEMGDPQDSESAPGTRVLLLSLYNTFPEDLSGISKGFIVLLADNTLLDSAVRLARLEALAKLNNIRLSYSLPIRELKNAHFLMEQSMVAQQLGTACNPQQSIDDFYHYGVDYLLYGCHSKKACELACQPDVWMLYQHAREGDEFLYETLKAYLTHERSIQKTAGALFVHKNTLIYRIRKLEEMLRYSLDDPYTREYMRLSFFTLERFRFYRQAGLIPDKAL